MSEVQLLTESNIEKNQKNQNKKFMKRYKLLKIYLQSLSQMLKNMIT